MSTKYISATEPKIITQKEAHALYLALFAPVRSKCVVRDQEGQWQEVRGHTAGFISDHLRLKNSVAVFSDFLTWYVLIDLDYHGKDRATYLEQARVLLMKCHGDGWHYDISERGTHFVRV